MVSTRAYNGLFVELNLTLDLFIPVSSHDSCSSERSVIRAAVIGVYPYVQYGNGTINGTDVDLLNLWKKQNPSVKVDLSFGRSFDGVVLLVRTRMSSRVLLA